MTIEDVLNLLDGNGLIIVDQDEIMNVLNEYGIAIFDKIEIRE